MSPDFSWLLVVKFEERGKSGEGFLGPKKLGCGGLEDSQPLQMAYGAKAKKWLLGRDQIQDTARKT